MKKFHRNCIRCTVDCKLQMRRKKATRNAALMSRMQSFQGFKENRRERLCIPNCKKAQTIRSPSTLTGSFPVACRCFYNLVSEDVCKRSNRPGNSSNRNKLGILILICLKWLILCNPHEK